MSLFKGFHEHEAPASRTGMSETRLDELEARYAQLEHTLGELSDVVWRQQRELDALKEQLGKMQDRFAADPGLVDGTRQDKPPHY